MMAEQRAKVNNAFSADDVRPLPPAWGNAPGMLSPHLLDER